jgi:hypothetical protein
VTCLVIQVGRPRCASLQASNRAKA